MRALVVGFLLHMGDLESIPSSWLSPASLLQASKGRCLAHPSTASFSWPCLPSLNIEIGSIQNAFISYSSTNTEGPLCNRRCRTDAGDAQGLPMTSELEGLHIYKTERMRSCIL